MRNIRFFTMPMLLAMTFLSPQVIAQEKTAPEIKTAPATLKVQLVISESETEKKVANLPYVFYLHAGDGGAASPWTKLRMGSRIPVATGSYQTSSSSGSGTEISPLVQFQYIDVGTNIDARALTAEGGRFDLLLNLERSWVSGDVTLPGDKSGLAASAPSSGQFKEPIIRQFRTELQLGMRDGQTTQTTQATDPVSGRVLTITVTVNVVK